MVNFIFVNVQIIRVLSNANWLPRNLVSLCALLGDVSSLSQSELDYTMDTIVPKFDLIEPDEMPATIFQLLLLSKDLNASRILYVLTEYYKKRYRGFILYYYRLRFIVE